MTYKLYIDKRLRDYFKKLKKRDKTQSEILKRKIIEIQENPHRFKPLKGDMKGIRRVRIRHFVLTFKIDDKNKVVKLVDYDHHDNIY